MQYDRGGRHSAEQHVVVWHVRYKGRWVTDDRMAAAKKAAAAFSARRLRLARESRGLTQRALADEMQRRNDGEPVISAAAISQAERDHEHTTPRPEHLLALAEALDYSVRFFELRPSDRNEPAQVFFRYLRSTPAYERRKCDSFVQIVEIVVNTLENHVVLPPWEQFWSRRDIDPSAPVANVASVIEDAAAEVRRQLRLEKGPIDRPLTAIERAGVVVVRDPDLGDKLTMAPHHGSQQVDAYSDTRGRRPIVVLTGAPGIPWDRDNHNVSHELGHIVLHTNAGRGPKAIEDQAHRFAAAFLAPADDVFDELPDTIDWHDYYELKLRWGMSIAALIRRAYDLGKLTKDQYVRAMKYRSAHGWRTFEPGHDVKPLLRPRMLALAIEASGLSRQHLSELTGVPNELLDRIIGPGPEPIIAL